MNTLKTYVLNDDFESLTYLIKEENELVNVLEVCHHLKKFQLGLNIIKAKDGLLRRNYYKVLKYNVLFAKETKNYFEAKRLIVNELSLPYIPKETEEFLNNELKEIEFEFQNKKSFDDELIENLASLSNNELFYLLSSIKQYNMQNHIDQLQIIFNNEKIADLTKSLLLAILSDQKINHEFQIKKCDFVIKTNPATLKDLRIDESSVYINKILNAINKNFHHNDFLMLNNLISSQQLVVYPYFYTKEECHNLILGAILTLQQLTKNDYQIEKYDFYNSNNKDKYQTMAQKINNLLSTQSADY